GLDGGGLQDATDVVHDQGGQGFALDVLGHDQQRAAGLGDLFQHRQQVADVADLLVEDQDERIIQHGDLLVGVVDEVGRQVAAVELHAFDDVQLVVQGLAVFDGDDAFLADLVHRVGDDFTDGGVAVGRDRTDLGDGLAGGAGLGQLVQFVDGSDHGLVDAALQVHGADAGGHVLQAFFDDGLGQHGGGGGAVTGVVGGLGGDFLDQLGADVLELVLQFDFLGDGDAVLGDGGGAEGAVQHHVAALGAHGGLDGIGEDVDAADDAGAGVVTEINLLCSHVEIPWFDGGGLLDHGEDFFLADDEHFLAIDLDGLAGILAEQNLVADLQIDRDHFAVLGLLAGADGQDFALIGLFSRAVRD